MNVEERIRKIEDDLSNLDFFVREESVKLDRVERQVIDLHKYLNVGEVKK